MEGGVGDAAAAAGGAVAGAAVVGEGGEFAFAEVGEDVEGDGGEGEDVVVGGGGGGGGC